AEIVHVMTEGTNEFKKLRLQPVPGVIRSDRKFHDPLPPPCFCIILFQNNTKRAYDGYPSMLLPRRPAYAPMLQCGAPPIVASYTGGTFLNRIITHLGIAVKPVQHLPECSLDLICRRL